MQDGGWMFVRKCSSSLFVSIREIRLNPFYAAKANFLFFTRLAVILWCITNSLCH